jgi:phosphoglycerol transferase MdoB-like AlkP superfamily enzyme
MFRVRFWLVSGGLFAIVFALIVASYKRKAPAWVATISSVLLTVFYVSDPVWRYFHKGGLGIGSLALWFFAGTLVAILEFKGERFREYPTAYERWSTPLFALFGLLLAFATTVYPQLKASWGGGTPANVTVYFTRGSLLSPNKAVQAQLVEESDEGFYIVGPKESKAIFVTRKDVALVYFSDKAAESPLMQGIK